VQARWAWLSAAQLAVKPEQQLAQKPEQKPAQESDQRQELEPVPVQESPARRRVLRARLRRPRPLAAARAGPARRAEGIFS